MAKTTTKRRKAPADPPADDAPPPAQEPSFPETHAFAFAPSATYATCPCGAERDLVLRDGMAVRVYRLMRTAPWTPSVVACPKSAGVKAPPPEPVRVAEQTPADVGSGPSSGLLNALREQFPDAFAPEIIGGSDVEKTAEHVMLDVACSPVVIRRDSMLACDVAPLGDDKYRVYVHADEERCQPASLTSTMDVSAARLKVMRARWLLLKGAFSRDAARMDPSTRARVERMLFPRGNVPWIPPVDSPLDKMAQDGVPYISIPHNGDAPVDFAAVMSMLSTPGAEVPAVCPVLPSPEDPAPPSP